MGKSILVSVKETIGIHPMDTSFDEPLILFINSAFSKLCQLGAGPAIPITITSDAQTWEECDFGVLDIGLVKSFVFLTTKQLFDPDAGAAGNARKALLDEYEWRIMVANEVNF